MRQVARLPTHKAPYSSARPSSVSAKARLRCSHTRAPQRSTQHNQANPILATPPSPGDDCTGGAHFSFTTAASHGPPLARAAPGPPSHAPPGRHPPAVDCPSFLASPASVPSSPQPLTQLPCVSPSVANRLHLISYHLASLAHIHLKHKPDACPPRPAPSVAPALCLPPIRPFQAAAALLPRRVRTRVSAVHVCLPYMRVCRTPSCLCRRHLLPLRVH